VLALYDRKGRLTELINTPGVLAAFEWTEFSKEISLPRGYTAKAFIWDADTYIPLLVEAVCEEPWDVDKSPIDEARAKVGAVDLDAYTRLSADAVAVAMEEAAAVYLDETATRPMVNAAAAKIDEALGKLSLPTDSIKLNGTVYGREGTYSSNGSNNYPNVFDGNPATFFDSNSGSDAWVGIDLGAGNETYVYSMRYYPRSGWVSRMNGCAIRGSMTVTNGNAGTLLHTVDGLSALRWYDADSEAKDQKFRYLWIQSGPEWWGNTGELEFYGRDIRKADLSLLSDRIAYAEALNPADYAPTGWDALQTALAAAKALSADSSQLAVDSAASALKTALAALTRL
jgi:hypothetical protein